MSFWDIFKKKKKPVMEFRVGEGLTPQQTEIAYKKIGAKDSAMKEAQAKSFWGQIKKEFTPREEAVPIRRAFEATPIQTKAPPIVTQAADLGFRLLEMVPKAAATIGGELKGKGKPTTVKANIDLRRLGFETPEYKTAALEQTEAIEKGENPWISGLRIMSNKTLDVAFGAQIASDLAKLSTRVLLAGGPQARIEALDTLKILEENQKVVFNRLKNAPLKEREEALASILNTKKEAQRVLETQGIPTALDRARVSASRYTEVLSRQTPITKNFWADIRKSNLELKAPLQPKPVLEAPQLPGYRRKPGQAPAMGLSTEEVESVGKDVSKNTAKAVDDAAQKAKEGVDFGPRVYKESIVPEIKNAFKEAQKGVVTEITKKNTDVVVNAVDRLIAKGRVRIIEQDGKNIFQVKNGDKWVTAKRESNAVNQLIEKYVPPKKNYAPKDQEKLDFAKAQLEMVRERLSEHPAKPLLKYIDRKEGQFEDFRSPRLAKTPKEAERIKAKNKKIMEAAENAFEGRPELTDSFDNADTIREVIEEYLDLRQTEKIYVSKKNELKKTLTPLPRSATPKTSSPVTELKPQQVKEKILSSLNESAQKLLADSQAPKTKENISYVKSITDVIENEKDAKYNLDRFSTDPLLDDQVNLPIDKNFLEDITEKAKVGSFQFKPVNSFLLYGRDPFRNMEAFFGKHWEEVKKNFLDPLDASKGDYIDTNKELADDLYEQVVEKLGIKKNTPESRAVMDYGERNLQGDFAPANPQDLASLKAEFGAEKAEKIVQADTYFRETYNKLIDRINAKRKEIYGDVWAKKQNMDDEIKLLEENLASKKIEMSGKKNKDTLVYTKLTNQVKRLQGLLQNRKDLLESDLWWRGKVIPKRNDYYRHYFELAEGFKALKNILTTDANISSQLAGISTQTKPKSKFLQFAQGRSGNKSERDAVGSLLNYIPSASYAIHIDPHIEGFRKLADALRASENKEYSPFIEFLTDFANDLAGKTNEIDRGIQKVTGRKIFKVVNWLNNRVKANTILGNASSSIAQIFSVPQGIASAKHHAIKGATRSFAQIFAKNKPMASSSFLKERYAKSITDKFNTGWLKKPKKFALWMLTALDEVGTKFVWNSHYEQALAKKIPNPVKYADDITRKLVAGRGIGEVPLIQKSQIFQIAAPFQLEVGNAWWTMKDFMSKKDFAAIALLFITGYLMNQGAKEIRGSDVVFDPIQALKEGLQAFAEDENRMRGAEKLGGRLAGEVLSNIPFGQTLASMYPEYGFGKGEYNLSRKELFGQGDPTRYGSGLLATKAFSDPLFKIVLPFGGAQVKKTYQGIKSLTEGGVSNKSGTLQFKQGGSKLEAIKAILFGQYATNNARDFFKGETVAEKELEKLNKLSPEEANKIMKGYKETDPSLYRKVKALKQDEKLGITEEDKKIRNMGVENLERAEYIFKKAQKLDTPEEKNAYIKDLRTKRIITDDVLQQLKELKNKPPEEKKTSFINKALGVKTAEAGFFGNKEEPKPKTYYIRDNEINDSDLEEAKAILFGEISNRSSDKQMLEAQTILNTAFNRMDEYRKRGKPKTLTEVLQMDNQYQAYKGKQYNKYKSGKIEELDKRKIAAIEAMLKKVKDGTFQNNVGKSVFYKHLSDGRISADDRKLFKDAMVKL